MRTDRCKSVLVGCAAGTVGKQRLCIDFIGSSERFEFFPVDRSVEIPATDLRDCVVVSSLGVFKHEAVILQNTDSAFDLRVRNRDGEVGLNHLRWGRNVLLDRYGIGSSAFQQGLLSFIQILNPKTAFNYAFSTVSAVNKIPEGHLFWQHGWIGFVVLGLWIVLPLAFGRWRFAHAELT